MDRARTFAWLIAMASGVGLIGSGYEMARRVQAYHAEHPPQVFAFMSVNDRAFTYAGRPVTFTDDVGEHKEPYLVVKYADDELRVRVTVPGNSGLPGLLGHTDWLRVVRFALRSGLDMGDFEKGLRDGKVRDRLAIITRTPRAGADPETWGAAWKRDWVYDFYEFRPEGGFEHERLTWPTNSALEPFKPGELRENTWEYQAALLLIPQAGRSGPSYKFTGDAAQSFGWTLPAGAVSGVALAFSLGWALGPGKRRGVRA